MKPSTILFLVFLFSASWHPPQSTRPMPPGLHEAQKAETQAQKNEVPPVEQRTTPDPAKLKRDADELASLAESIPSEVDQTSKGVLPQDLNGKLKRIEKLAKKLRSQLTP